MASRGGNRGRPNSRRTDAGKQSSYRDQQVHRDPDIGGVFVRLAKGIFTWGGARKKK